MLMIADGLVIQDFIGITQGIALLVCLLHAMLEKSWCNVMLPLIINAKHALANQITLYTVHTEAAVRNALMDTSILIILVKPVITQLLVLKTKDLLTAPQDTTHFVLDVLKAKNI